jgi:hypothetical protein
MIQVNNDLNDVEKIVHHHHYHQMNMKQHYQQIFNQIQIQYQQ